MTELLQTAADLLREGVISPTAFTVLVVCGIVVWGAAKLGDRMLRSVGGLVDAGEKVRQSLSAQILASDARALQFQTSADQAIAKLALLSAEHQALQVKHDAIQLKFLTMERDLQEATAQMHHLRSQLPGEAPE